MREGLQTTSVYHKTRYGTIVLGDSLAYMKESIKDASVDLIVTSPPFGLVRKKKYGNVDAHEYIEWFKPFGQEFKRILKPAGSLVIDIGGAWIPGQPTRSLYHYELAIMLNREVGFHLAQEFFWWNPSKLPTPAEWVTVRRIRAKDAVDCVWWFSPTPWPRASNRRILAPYSDAMRDLLRNGYRPKLRPSGHDISGKFTTDNGAAIPPNLIAIPNTESNSYYLRYCKQHSIEPHPARYPAALPEFFVRMLTNASDTVLDPFAGSCVTGEVCERLRRNWTCVEIFEDYLKGALGRFERPEIPEQENLFHGKGSSDLGWYKIFHPAKLWNGSREEPLPEDGGRRRTLRPVKG
ncbi:MAG TPA: site-specific DNA-methyltransferase [Terriglobia bacterium]|nr:site-specific DNA-methyltransferase [Terriglobia bacterium]